MLLFLNHLDRKRKFTGLMLLFVSTLFIMTSNKLHAEDNSNILRLATTTSTQNSGLLDKLLPAFKQQTEIDVHVVAVGTGKALKMGRDGDADVVMVHAKKAEDQFMQEKHGDYYKQFMFNDFVLVGPVTDPAGIAAAGSVAQAMQTIHQNQTIFISRGDDSGTHTKELELWKIAGLSPSGTWYREIGQGMGKALQMSNELQGYTLTDRGTWLAMQDKLDLKLLFAGDKSLNNPYGIIAVSAEKYPDLNHTGAVKLVDWVCTEQAQSIITHYKIKGDQLFYPIDCQ